MPSLATAAACRPTFPDMARIGNIVFSVGLDCFPCNDEDLFHKARKHRVRLAFLDYLIAYNGYPSHFAVHDLEVNHSQEVVELSAHELTR